MKIGMFYKALISVVENNEVDSIGDGIKKMSDIGISYYEVSADDIDSPYKETKVLSLIENNGAEIGSLYFKKEINPKDKNTFMDLYEYTVSKIQQCIRIHCKQLMPVVFLKSDDKEDYKLLLDYYDKVSKLSDKYGIITVIENFHNTSTRCFTMEDIKMMLENTSKLGYLLDTGNYWFAKESSVQAADVYKNDIKSVHLKDILPSDDNIDNSGVKIHFTSIGNGKSSIKETIKHLEMNGYEKSLTIEMEKFDEILPKIYDSVRFIKQSESEIVLCLTAMEYYERLFKYAQKYESFGECIELKTLHMFAVANIMNTISTRIGVNKEFHKIAIITGLLHDVGRYEQIKRYNTFNDTKSIDHANLSAKILEDENLLRGLTSKEQQMIITAIKNHNKYAIEPGLDKETLILCKMIRDADKIDIFRVVSTDSYENSFTVTKDELENSKISDSIYNSIMHHELVDIRKRQYPLDYILGCIAFIYDINYPVSREIIKEKNNYLCGLDLLTYKNSDTCIKIQEIFDEIRKFLKN